MSDCKCSICALSKHFQTLAEKATKPELEAMETVWDRMEVAETKIDWDKGISKERTAG